jgi:hypothetical protein
MAPRIQPIIDRFWSKIDVRGVDECWEWKGAKTTDGYGQLHTIGRRGKQIKAHRFSYELHIGPIPDNMCVCHSCDNPGCVNPRHFFLGSNLDNIQDRNHKGRTMHGEEHWNARLTKADVQAIRDNYRPHKHGERPRLSQKYHVSEGTISDIIGNRSWVH